MAIRITEECINCGACEPECPNTAIYPNGMPWTWAAGTGLTDKTTREPLSEALFYIVPGKCTECTGFHEEPQCAAVCPVDCCLPDPDHVETKDALLAKVAWLHPKGN